MITAGALDLARNALYGDTVDLEINYVAVGDGTTAVTGAETQLVNETFRTAVLGRTKGTTGILDTVADVLDTDGALTIREIGFFAGGTATANSATLVSRILWTKDKTTLESIQFNRRDTIGRG